MARGRSGRIEAALGVALARPSGDWFVLAGSSRCGRAGRSGGSSRAWRWWRGAAPTARCTRARRLPAPRGAAGAGRGARRPRWSAAGTGCALPAGAGRGWRALPAHDDGVLVWVRLDELGGERRCPSRSVPGRALAGGSAWRPSRRSWAVRTRRRAGQPARSVARRLVPPVLVRAPAGAAPDAPEPVPASRSRLRRGPAGHSGDRRIQLPRAAHRTDADRRRGGRGSVVETHATPLAAAPTAAPHRGDRGGRRPLRPARVRRGRARRAAAASGDAYAARPALARRPRLRRAPLRAAVGTEVAITPSIRGSCAGWR